MFFPLDSAVLRMVRDRTAATGLVRELIDRSAAGDGDAWRALWNVIHGATSWQIRRLLAARGVDASEADDLIQEFYLYLSARSWARLQTFRGESEAELRQFARVIALRFARRCLLHRQRVAHREKGAIQARGEVGPEAGPTEPEEYAALERLAEDLDEQDRALLQAVLDPSGVFPRSDRTYRRWAKRISRRLIGRDL